MAMHPAVKDPPEREKSSETFSELFFLKTTILKEFKNQGLPESLFNAWLTPYLTGLIIHLIPLRTIGLGKLMVFELSYE